MNAPQDEPTFGVRIVSKRAHLPPNTIRTWERRHGIAPSYRTETGRRRFTVDDIERLNLIRQLRERGEPMDLLASLNLDELRARFEMLADVVEEDARPSRNRSTQASVQLIVVGDALLNRLPRLSPRFRTQQVSDINTACEQASQPESAYLVLVQADQLRPWLLRHSRLPEGVQVFACYDFAPQAVLSDFSEAGIHLLRLPVGIQLLETILGRASDQQLAVDYSVRDGKPPEALLDVEQLTRISESRPNIECECPLHLSHLVSSLKAFEAYCERCESENPKDSLMHRNLHRETAVARAILEESLIELCLHDGIAIPPSTQP